MNAPDKIFILNHKDYSDRRILNAFTEKDNETDIEYIRKDALLEWAKKKNKRIDTEEGDYSLGYVSAMIDLIDKIESL